MTSVVRLAAGVGSARLSPLTRARANRFAKTPTVVTGCKSEKDILLASRKFARIIQKSGHPSVTFQDFKHQNFVAQADCGFPIHLESLAYGNPMFAHYEAEVFPGLVYRLGDPKATFLVFVSGNVMITGCRSRQDVYNAWEAVYGLFKKYAKDAPAAINPE